MDAFTEYCLNNSFDELFHKILFKNCLNEYFHSQCIMQHFHMIGIEQLNE